MHDYNFVENYKWFDIYYDKIFDAYCYKYWSWFRESNFWDLEKVKKLIDKRVSEKWFSFDLLDV